MEGPDNRGTKLAFLPSADQAAAPAPSDPLRRVRGPTADDPAGALAVEDAFIVAQHLRASGAALSAGEARLLAGAWARWAEDAPGLRAARGLPARWLSSAADAAAVRETLGAGAILRQSHDIMAGIEADWRRLRRLRRFRESLAALVAPPRSVEAVAESEGIAESAPEVAPEAAAAVARTQALCLLLDERTRALHAELGRVRADLERAARYARLVGRFLVKRHRRIVGSMSTNI